MTSTNLRGSKVPGWEDGEFGHKLGELITTIVDIIKSTIDDAKEVSICYSFFPARVRLMINVLSITGSKPVYTRRRFQFERSKPAFQLHYMSR